MYPVSNIDKAALQDLSDEAFYDLFAPVVYGQIIRVVPQVPIANKILEKVFMNAFRNRMVMHSSLRSPLITLLNQSRDKTQATLEALYIFRECCAGASVNIADKNIELK